MGKIERVVGKRPQTMTALEPGTLLDRRYLIVQALAKGGFGRTYVAEDTRRPGNPKCVVKHLKPASNDSMFLSHARRLFATEAETLEQLGNHDQIPRLLAYFEEDQEFYLVQDLIEGAPLGYELKIGQGWTENQVCQMLRDVLNVLVFVHEHGVIHRDIKPDNIIRRRRDGKLVLVDFGAVKQIQTRQMGEVASTIAVGTPGYMPTEQSYGKPRPSSDIYALGIVGIQAATGLIPAKFEEDSNTGEIIWQPWAKMNDGLAAILTRMVRYHFKERYQSAIEALQALEQLIDQHPDLVSVTNSNVVPLKPISKPLIQPIQKPILQAEVMMAATDLGTTLLSDVEPSTDVILESPQEVVDALLQELNAPERSPNEPDSTLISLPAAVQIVNEIPPLNGLQPTLVSPEPVDRLPAKASATTVNLRLPKLPSLRVGASRSWFTHWKTITGIGCATVLIIGVPSMINALSPVESTETGFTNLTKTPFPELLLLNLPCKAASQPTLSDRQPSLKIDGTHTYTYYGAVEKAQPADGTGTKVFANGDRYDGEFHDGQANGCGTVTFANSYVRSYVGQFQDGGFHGLGVLTWKNGDRYIGEFENGKCQGQGTFIPTKGKPSQSGTWRNGALLNSNLSCNAVNE